MLNVSLTFSKNILKVTALLLSLDVVAGLVELEVSGFEMYSFFFFSLFFHYNK